MRINISFNRRMGLQHILKRFALILITGWASSCENDDNPATPSLPVNACVLVSSTISSTGKQNDSITFTSLNKRTLTYDEAGNRTAFTSSYEYKTSAGYKSSSNNNTIYEYNKNGFVQRLAMQENRTENGSTSYSNYNYTYEYDKDLLVKQTGEITVGGQTRIGVTLYEYDSNGKLVKLYDPDTNAGMQIDYLGSKVSKITLIDATGQTTYPYVEYNEKGLLLKSVITYYGTTDEKRFEYNADGLLTRSERYQDNKPEIAYSYEYDTQENPDSQISFRLKGHPWIPSVNGNPSYKHNVSKLVIFSPDDKEEWQVKSSTVSTYTYNAKGFPTNVIAKNLDKNGVELSTTTTTFVYEGCQ